jgi:CheY-like chemotaxis protein
VYQTMETNQTSLFANDGRARVLVVDDDAETRRLVERALVRAGYAVLEASSGEEALKLLARMARQGARIDLVISDIKMPDGDDLQALAEVQRRYGAPPVILMTAYDRREIYREAIHLGAAAVLRKPIDLLQLLLAVRVRIHDRAA